MCNVFCNSRLWDRVAFCSRSVDVLLPETEVLEPTEVHARIVRGRHTKAEIDKLEGRHLGQWAKDAWALLG